MKGFFRHTAFVGATLLLTGGLLYLIQFIYFSEYSRAFNVVGVLMALILYSNLLAKMYGFTQQWPK